MCTNSITFYIRMVLIFAVTCFTHSIELGRASPCCSPPRRIGIQIVEEISFLNCNVTITSRPTSFSMIAGSQGASGIVQGTVAFATSLAHFQLHLQFFQLVRFSGCTFFAYQFRSGMMYKFLKHVGVNFFASQLLLTSLACVGLHILRTISFFAARFAHQ